ncbi:MAG: hypothetical protein KJ626_12985 [Verrucomicrobia bacterium]|nr:hypothetical protein [Verrucomicrobiota bacterium]
MGKRLTLTAVFALAVSCSASTFFTEEWSNSEGSSKASTSAYAEAVPLVFRQPARPEAGILTPMNQLLAVTPKARITVSWAPNFASADTDLPELLSSIVAQGGQSVPVGLIAFGLTDTSAYVNSAYGEALSIKTDGVLMARFYGQKEGGGDASGGGDGVPEPQTLTLVVSSLFVIRALRRNRVAQTKKKG